MGAGTSSGSAPKVKALNCPKCGAALAIRGFEHTLTVVCEHCLSILDAKDPNLQVLQTFADRQRIPPLIPLGARGKLRGDTYEVIGFQVRTTLIEGEAYSWSEYLLFNPYKGFRYLTEYQGHWNDVAVLNTLPEVRQGRRLTAALLGETYRHFQTYTAETSYVLGEFPWQVRVGESSRLMDFVAPPRMLSKEMTEQETVWSLGEYTPGARVWEIFKLPGRPKPPQGTYANQPSPYEGSVRGVWRVFGLLLLALLALALGVVVFSQNREVFRGTYTFSPRAGGESSFVTSAFELKGHPSNVEVAVSTDLSNNWIYFNFALINLDTGQAYDFGREVSYYSGRDSDGAWSEGGRRDRAFLPTVPAGNYYLRVEPEMDANAAPVRYDIAVRRDVPRMMYFGIAALLLLIPPVLATFRSLSFEQRRWQESDYGS